MSLIGYIVDEIFELGNLLEDQVGGAQSIDTNLLNSKSKPGVRFPLTSRCLLRPLKSEK